MKNGWKCFGTRGYSNLHVVKGEKINGKKDLERPRTSFIKKLISDARLTNYNGLKRPTDGNRDAWREYGKLQNQPRGWIPEEEGSFF